MEDAARTFAFTQEEAMAYLSEMTERAGGPAMAPGQRTYHLDTAADLVAEWREFLREQQAKWA